MPREKQNVPKKEISKRYKDGYIDYWLLLSTVMKKCVIMLFIIKTVLNGITDQVI